MVNKSPSFFSEYFPLTQTSVYNCFRLGDKKRGTHPVTRSSSRACSIASSSSLVSIFFLHAFFPFLDFWDNVAGVPKSSVDEGFNEVTAAGTLRS